jgi:DnaK suppressor protein
MSRTVLNLPSHLIEECKTRLLKTKSEILNRVREGKREFAALDKGSDEADQSMSQLAENEFLTSQSRLKMQLLEIEYALARIAHGTYGVCEETEEPIEIERLRALPWTRVSLEGAEIQEALRRKFAR